MGSRYNPSGEELERALNALPDLIWSLDSEKRIRWMNVAMAERLGVDPSKVVGLTCSQAVHGNTCPPAFCPNQQSFETQRPYTTEVYVEQLGGYFAVSCIPLWTPEGQFDGSVIIARDINERVQKNESLRQLTRFRDLLIEISSRFIGMPFEEARESLQEALRQIGLFVNADRAYVFDYDWEKNICKNTFEWCAEGISPEIDNLQEVPLATIPWFAEAHAKGEILSIPDVFALDESDGVRKVLEPQRIKSLITVPIMLDNSCVGFVGFDSVRHHRIYSDTEIYLLTLFAQLLAGLKSRQAMLQQLTQAKQKAEEANAIVTAILEGTTESIWSFDRDYRILYINTTLQREFHAAFGVWLEKGTVLMDALPEPYKAIWKTRYDRVMANERFTVEDEVDTAVGKQNIQVAFTPIVKEGEVIGGFCFGRNITDQKRAETELLSSNKMLESLLDAITDVIGIQDPEFNTIRYNAAGCAFFGMTREEIKGKKCYELYGYDHPCETCAISQSYKTQQPARVEKFIPERGIWFEVSSYPVFDANGNVQVIIKHLRDITERKRMEEALQKRLVALTQPWDNSDSAVTFEDLFNVDDIQKLQDEFARATGVASIITRPDGTPITAPSNFTYLCNNIIRKTEKGLLNCYKSDAVIGRPCDKGPTISPCLSGGLWDAGAAISVGGHHVANWLVGQVRDETQTEEKIRAYAREIGADEDAVVQAFLKVPAMSRDQFEKISQMLFTLANQLSSVAYQNVQQARFITELKRAEEERDKL